MTESPASIRKRDEDEAYEAWKVDFLRFDPISDTGPLIRDHKTGMVYDVTEFWMRLVEEESHSGAKAR